MTAGGIWDVIVIGGGPSGLAAAIRARSYGMRTLLFERRSGVVDKACGEGLMPGALTALRALGVEVPRSHPLRGIRYVQGGHEAFAAFQGGGGLGVRRTVLHRALRDRALAVGAVLRRGSPDELSPVHEGVCVAGDRARYVVAADGLHSPIRRQLGLALPPRRPARYGIRRHFAVAPWSDEVEVHWSPDAEAYVTPVDDRLVGVAVLFRGRGRYDDWLGHFSQLHPRLRNPVSPARGAGPFEQRVRTRVWRRVLLVGDAAGYVDPLTGEGVRVGLATACAAIDRIAQHRPQRYEGDWARLTRSYRWLTLGLLAASARPRIRPGLTPLLAHASPLFEGAVRLLAGDPSEKPSA